MIVTGLHYELHVRDLAASRKFYVDQLGLPILQETAAMRLLAVRAGLSRISLFADRTDQTGPGPSQVILAVENIEDAIADLKANGIEPSGPPTTAGTFLKFITIKDPDGNTVAISEYLRNPTAPT